MEVGRILSRSRRAVKFGLNGHSTRVRGKTWLSLSPGVPSSCAFHPAGAAAAAGGGGGLVGRAEAGTKVLGAKREVEEEEEVENKGSGAEYFNIYHGEIGTRVCRRESLLPRHFPPPPCSSTPRLANRRLRCPTARSDSPLSTPSLSLPLVLVPRDMFIRPADYACYTMVRKNGRKETANFFSVFLLLPFPSLSHLLILIGRARGKNKSRVIITCYSFPLRTPRYTLIYITQYLNRKSNFCFSTARMNSDRTRRDTPLPKLRLSTQTPTISVSLVSIRAICISQ